MDAKAGKYLTFALHTEEYGLEILKVREIIGYMKITKVPQVDSCIKGVINLRGQVIPIIDLRMKFGMPEAEVTEETCIIVVEALRDGDTKQVGIIVDSVSEVHDITTESMEPPPEFGGTVDRELIMAMAKIEEVVVILLNIDRVLFDEQMDAMLAGQ
jgi:purine-binding chemotaxis protein CheW